MPNCNAAIHQVMHLLLPAWQSQQWLVKQLPTALLPITHPNVLTVAPYPIPPAGVTATDAGTAGTFGLEHNGAANDTVDWGKILASLAGQVW